MRRISIFLWVLAGLWTVPMAAQQTQRLVVLQTGDTHSRMEPIAPTATDENAGRGGVVRRATFVKQFRAEHPAVLLFDCGDISQGTPYYNLFRGELEVKMMNLMQYDAMTIGNHEFDFGLDNLARLFRMARFPVVCANYDVSGTVLEGLVKPYVVLERYGLRIGVFGVSPQPEGLVASANCQGIEYEDAIEAAQRTATLLKEKEKCDVIVCLSHLGTHITYPEDAVDDEKLIAGTKYIDVVLGGHTHTFMKAPMLYPNAEGKQVPLLHTGKNGAHVGRIDLDIVQE